MAFEPNDPALEIERAKLVEQQNAERNVRVAEKQAILVEMRAAAQASNLALAQEEQVREGYRQQKAVEAALMTEKIKAEIAKRRSDAVMVRAKRKRSRK